MKTIEKKLPIGRWRITLKPESGHEITDVNLCGLRGKPYPIRKATEEEFFERHPKDELGNPRDTEINLRGMPQLWFHKGWQIYLWPAPSQDWTVQITVNPRAA